MKKLLALLPPWVPLALLGIAIVAGVGGYYAWREHQRTIGAGKVVDADRKATTVTQKRIDDAEARAPRTPADVSKRMRDGSF